MKRSAHLYEQLMDYYTKQELLEMGKAKKIPVRSNLRKGEIALQMAEEMLRPEVVSRYLRWLDPDECHSFLSLAGVEDTWGEDEDIEEWLPWRLLYTGYMYFDEESGELFLPEDVRNLVRRVWTPEQKSLCKQYTWIRQCIELGTQLYGVMPYDILARLIRQKVQYGAAVSVIPRIMEDIPPEMNTYGIGEKGIYSMDIEPVLFKLEFPEDTEDYYIPSVMEIENGIFYTKEFQNIMTAKLNVWKQKFQHPFLDIENTIWLICKMKSLECASCPMTELIALVGDYDLYDEDSHALTAIGNQLCRALQKSDRHFRRVRYHGFTKDEWDERKSSRPQETAWKRNPSAAERREPQTAKIISLDEQREKRKKKQ